MLLVLALFACGGPATLTDVQDEVFGLSCALSTCHGSGSGGIDLSSAAASHASLVNQPAHFEPNTRGCEADGQDTDTTDRDDVLVIPGDPENSYLVEKLRGDDDIVGSPMPECTSGLATTSPAQFDLVVSWIEDGAQNN